MAFGWRSGYSTKLDAAQAHQELERIRKQYGTLTRHAVLEAAEEEDNPLHDEFVWDDGEAAARYRLAQAGDLIRAVRVIGKDSSQSHKYVHVRVEEREYEPLDVVVRSQTLYDSAMGAARQSLQNASEYVNELIVAAEKGRSTAPARRAKTHIQKAQKALS
jgi:hypothetical protein